MKEVELRCFVNPRQAHVVLEKIDALGYTQLTDERQITYYLDTPTDTRVQISSRGGRVWQKLGKMHDESREEFNAPMTRESAEAMISIFKNMGYKFKVAWLRHRCEFTRGDLMLTVDYTVGYGWIIEVERQSDEDDTSAVVAQLKQDLAQLGLEPSPKDTFDAAYKDYLEHWQERTAECMGTFLNEGVTAV
jgi:adenylate cyclase class IV